MAEYRVLIGIGVGNLRDIHTRVPFDILHPLPTDFRRPGSELVDVVDFPDRAFRMIGSGNVMPREIAHAAVSGLTGDDRAVGGGVLADKHSGAGFGIFRPACLVRKSVWEIKNRKPRAHKDSAHR